MKKRLILTGKKFGRLRVGEVAFISNSNAHYHCICDCGNKKVVVGFSLLRGTTKSCGCLRKELRTKTGVLNGWFKRKKQPKIYITWSMMKQRCYNPNYKYYYNYGGRGIKTDDRWLGKDGFKNFYEDMNKSMEEHIAIYGKKNTSIDRINNELGYSKENCRWATVSEQANNKRINLPQEIKNLAKKSNISGYRVTNLIKNGIKEERLLIHEKNHRIKDGTKWLAQKDIFDELKDKISYRKEILEYHFLNRDDCASTLEDTGKKFGLTRERIRQIIKRSLLLAIKSA